MSDTGAGSHRDQSPSASTFLSTLIPVLIIVAVILSIFLILRPKYKRVYEPRTYLPLLRKYEYTPQPSDTKFGWVKNFRGLNDDHVLMHSSLDNYLFLRLFKILFTICLVGAIITWPILFPINATGGAGNKQFDLLSFSNVSIPSHTNYYYAHAILAWVFVGFVMVVITREIIYFISLRQSIITSVAYSSRLSARTVMFTNVDQEYLKESALRELFTGVSRVWIQPNTKELDDVVGDRDDAVTKLETAENKLVKKFVKNHKKAEKKGKTDTSTIDRESGRVEVDHKIRPTHRLGKIPLIGKKVDTIDWARPEITRLNKQVDEELEKTHNAEKVPAVFVQFETLEHAQAAHRQLSSGMQKVKGAKLTPKVVGVHPNDVIWGNLSKKNMVTRMILIASTIFVVLMIVFWAIPVAFVGVISNIKTLETISFLTWISSIPDVILGVITGLLPAVMLAVLMALVPIVLRLLAGMFEPTRSTVELRVQAWYFSFQVVDVFLVTTFSSGAAAVAKQIVNNPGSAPMLLASNLPLASNFYTAYFVVTMLNQAAMLVLNIAPLLFIAFLGNILDSTPRKVYNRYTNLIGLGWGSVYPAYAMLGVIAIAYSCIAPLLLGFATVGFALLYFAYRYQLLYVVGNDSIDMKGRAYARAMQQITVGVYLLEFCLIGLFAIGVAEDRAALGPLIITIILAVFTIVYHVILSKTLGPIVDGLEMMPGSEDRSRAFSAAPTENMEEGKPSTTSNRETSPTLAGSTDSPKPKSGLKGKLQHFFFSSRFATKWLTVQKELASHFNEPIRPYTQEELEYAFVPPSMLNEQAIVWIARDEYGLSSQEVAGCKEHDVPATDEEATLNEKAKIEWSQERIREAPVYEEKIPY
ncbi:hypothetical protein AUEXF2481DRAFT_4876 [Aureobasidium subglaciale EXF-2481]|uniref:DUF221-domain-containing protein n=1 Tax=Aureobasidium subglaciale (strain EXF-2481) TaxID=1043005 RepID=A0A074YBZ5_AURSE|nr:uncharacterized protein AUEXF2481DRAFT_4876 [Aureobasidium subglaciale EXF-2481]KAI5195831.1 DUF221-domain-containing protein [Aureobasidium subglaciale]KAI5214757.1 DUF221-domain-containing protein [Aureobasidium subglaciale]KAI5217722.1 DUF221-domain-containing protein [Aureobasidium subglaciale]KAI5255360.1 DUF221-domain-containing protein [Aureobasidium subglaciale]KEQ95255.1 hypothetical protein AUEXF2481DRAFT_4876 [Aureobasidium subglaciale EXF-2481]